MPSIAPIITMLLIGLITGMAEIFLFQRYHFNISIIRIILLKLFIYSLTIYLVTIVSTFFYYIYYRSEDSLDAAGVSVDDITHVVFTHAHPDHIWGLLDEFDEPLFYEAAYHIGRQEWEYWTDPATVDTIGLERQSFAVGAARRLAVLEDSINLFEDASEILPGIASVASFGHTPGHMAFDVGGKVLVGGAGVGLYPHYVEAATSFTIVERSPIVIKLVAPLLKQVLDERGIELNFVLGDIGTYLAKADPGA